MAPDPLTRALSEPGDLRPLPNAAADLLRSLDAPPRLAAHLRLVHDVAAQLADWVQDRCPDLALDREAALFGAATHDIGKTVHLAELSGPGSLHEEAGRALLTAHGFAPRLARFAATHASWTAPEAALEDLLVSAADKIWKNKRVTELEDLLVARLARSTGKEHWEEYLALDEILGSTGEGADARLAFQASFPIHA
ncbi:HD domain-containing protein [Glycomyces harbinensis]|uniref:HD domain-containing protein n=1 Tax=Glycomyces harbinensis TaxID=58114 RepID=UPI000B8844B1|nr:HD domain-containing protein [Glycomyces harbinensis]